jgi:hypothetical protein
MLVSYYLGSTELSVLPCVLPLFIICTLFLLMYAPRPQKSIRLQSSNAAGITLSPICLCVVCRSACGLEHNTGLDGAAVLDWRWSCTAPLHATWRRCFFCRWTGQGVQQLQHGGRLAPPFQSHRGLPTWLRTALQPWCSASPTLPSGEHLGFLSSLPLLYIMMCSSQCNS